MMSTNHTTIRYACQTCFLSQLHIYAACSPNCILIELIIYIFPFANGVQLAGALLNSAFNISSKQYAYVVSSFRFNQGPSGLTGRL
jgi:hypothetical protein